MNALKGEFVLTDEGLLSSADYAAADETPKLLGQVISLATSVASGVIGLDSAARKSALSAQLGKEVVSKDPFCFDIAAEILDVRSKRIDMLTRTPGNGDAARFGNDELLKQEAALLRHFTGYVRRDVGDVTCFVKLLDEHNYWDTVELFRAGDAGLTESYLPRSRCSIPSELRSDQDPEKSVFLTIESADDGLPTTPAEPQGQGVFYRLPGRARIILRAEEEPLLDHEYQVAQYGALARLPGGSDLTFGKAEVSSAFGRFGNLQTMGISGEPVDLAPVLGALQSGGADVLEALTARQKLMADQARSTAAQNDELSRLENRRKKLEELKKIMELESAMGIEPQKKGSPQ